MDAGDIPIFLQFQSDDIYKQFLSEDFDVKTVASNALQGVAISDQLAKLTAGISLLDKEMHEQVSSHYEDLLSQATEIEILEGVLQMMHSRIQTLQATAERLRAKVVEPFDSVENQTAKLRRLQATCDLLRRMHRLFHLSRRLQTQLQGGTREITKAAQCLNEIDYWLEGVDLTGIDAVEKDLRIIRSARLDVEAQAEQMLERGMETQNQASVATALQVFHNLQILHAMVHKILEKTRDQLHQSVKECLDVKILTQQPSGQIIKGGPGRAAMPMPGNAALFRATLWTNMEKLMDHMYSSCNKIQHLQKVLAKKRDPASHVCFYEELLKSGQENIVHYFWNVITHILTEEFSKAASESTFVKQAFEEEYPKLLRLYNDLWRRLHQFNASVNVTVGSNNSLRLPTETEGTMFAVTEQTDNFSIEKALRSTLLPFENAYLARSLSRLSDSVNVAISVNSRDPPTEKDVKEIVKVILSELNVASVDHELSKQVAKNVITTIKIFSDKCEHLLATDGEATQVINPPTPSQMLNATIVHLLQLFHDHINTCLSEAIAPLQEAKDIIRVELPILLTLVHNAIQPLLISICDAIEAIILTMHKEDFSNRVQDLTSSIPEAPCSLYMKELQSFLARIQQNYLSQFPRSDIVDKKLVCLQ